MVPFGRRRLLGVVVDLAERERAAAGAARGAARGARGRRAASAGARSGCGWPREYCSTPARGLALVLPPGHRHRRRRGRCARERSLRAALTDGRRGRAAPSGARLGDAPARACSRRSRGAPLGAAALARARRLRPLDAAQPRAARAACGSSSAAERRGARASSGVGRAAPAASRSPPPSARRSTRIEAALEPGGRPSAACCSTGSPAAARPRSTCARWPRRSSAAARRSCSCPRSRSRRRPPARFVERFGDQVAVLHSRLVAARALRRVVADAPRRGARLRRPALGGVRAVRRPRPDRRRRGARLLLQAGGRPALRRARGGRAPRRRAEGALLLAGSATPRPESCVRYERLELPERVDGRPLPPVELVGMAGVGRRRSTSARARRSTSVRRREREGDRAAQPARLVELPLLPLLRRACGSARTATSRSCCTAPPARWPATTAATASAVPRCAPTAARCRWRATAPGTEQLERELEELVGAAAGVPARLRRGRGGRAWPRCCARSTRRRAGVLVGTQMVAKGHDFPDVTLGVVLDADATLRFPDFRAEERTFALVAQLAGPQRARRARRARDRAGARPDGRGAALRRRGTTPSGFLADELRAPRGCSATRPTAT